MKEGCSQGRMLSLQKDSQEQADGFGNAEVRQFAKDSFQSRDGSGTQIVKSKGNGNSWIAQLEREL